MKHDEAKSEEQRAKSLPHDARRDAILSAATEVRPREAFASISTMGLHALFRLAASHTGRMAVKDLNHNLALKSRISMEDVQPLIDRGWIERGSHHVLEMTDAGNALVRELLAWVNGKGGVA